MLAVLLFVALLVIRGAPDSVPGRALHRWLVDWPAERLARLTCREVLCWLGLGLTLWAVFAVIGSEAARLLSMAMPETLAWFAMFDMSVVADALVAAAIIATQTRLRTVAARLRCVRFRRSVRPRARAPRRRTATPEPANDEEPAPAIAAA